MFHIDTDRYIRNRYEPVKILHLLDLSEIKQFGKKYIIYNDLMYTIENFIKYFILNENDNIYKKYKICRFIKELNDYQVLTLNNNILEIEDYNVGNDVSNYNLDIKDAEIVYNTSKYIIIPYKNKQYLDIYNYQLKFIKKIYIIFSKLIVTEEYIYFTSNNASYINDINKIII